MLVRYPNGLTHDLLAFYTRSMRDVTASMDVVSGSDVVASELQNGRAELGFAQAGSIYTAFRTGLGETPSRFTNLRAIAVVGRSPVWLAVRRDSPVRTIAGLKGKRIGLVLEGATQSYVQMILDGYGVRTADVRLVPMSESERMARLEDGSLDAAVFASTTTPEFAEWHRRLRLQVLDINDAVIVQLRTRYPFMTPELIRREAFPGLDRDVRTIAVDYVLASRADLDENFVYELTKGFVGQFEDFARRNPRDLLVDPEQALATPIPLHAGAERFYREREVLR
jgi:TRAP transporter TAXI family solute receptor